MILLQISRKAMLQSFLDLNSIRIGDISFLQVMVFGFLLARFGFNNNLEPLLNVLLVTRDCLELKDIHCLQKCANFSYVRYHLTFVDKYLTSTFHLSTLT